MLQVPVAPVTSDAKSRLIYYTRFDEAHSQSADTHERRRSKSASFGSTATRRPPSHYAARLHHTKP